jgi:hypothetical protein
MIHFKKGDKIIITVLSGRTRRIIAIGDVGVLSKTSSNGWYAWIDGFECFLNSDTTTFKLLNANKMTNNLAKIIYRNTVDGKIEILRFENVLSVQELEKKFGKEVARIYFYANNQPSFQRLIDCIHCSHGYNIATGICSFEHFQNRIRYLKQCGKRLGEIRRLVEKEEFTKERVITI